MQAQAIAWAITVDQAGIGLKVVEPGQGGCAVGQFQQHLGQYRPGLIAQGIDRTVAVALAITHPTQRPAIGQPHSHLQPTGCEHMAKRRLGDNLTQYRQQRLNLGQGKAWQ
ncbi:hypothetical protein D3C75_1040590 [compost metagenome]